MKKSILTLVALTVVGIGAYVYSNSIQSDEPLLPQATLHEVENPQVEAEPKLAFNSKEKSEKASDASLPLIAAKKTSALDSFVFDPSNPLTFYKASIPGMIAEKTGDRWVAQSDLLIDPKAAEQSKGSNTLRMVVIDQIKYWDSGQIPFEIVDQRLSDRIEMAMTAISSISKIEFIPKTNETDFILLKSDPNDQSLCQSHLGKIGGEQELIVGTSCAYGQIIHELMHALGFLHEQSREDRDQYITLIWDNMLSNSRHNFQRLPAAISNPATIEFDFNSIMMYGSDAFSKNGMPTIISTDGKTFQANRRGLSERDGERLRKVYEL